MHTQIVMCEGLNDGVALRKRSSSFTAFFREFSLLRSCRPDLRNTGKPLSAFHSEQGDGEEAIRIIEGFQERFLENNGETRFVFASDEMYIRAGVDLPPYEAYEDFVQIRKWRRPCGYVSEQRQAKRLRR